jgi:leucyl-tRNA synthetase
VNPDDVVAEYGADTLRLYEMFIGDFEKAAPWSTSSMKGCRRFIERYFALQDITVPGDSIRTEMEISFNKTIKKVSEDIENLKFNTAIAALMSLLNEIAASGSITREELRIFTILLDPFAPHVAEEVWAVQQFNDQMACQQAWPDFDESKCKDATVEIAVQVNGKVRARVSVPADVSKEDALAAAKANEKIAGEISGKNLVKEIYVPGKLINLVAKG